jgi:uncharacterized YigZ family protein
VQNPEEAKTQLERVRKEYHDARHHCYAYRIGEEPGDVRFNDDGEPSGTAGKPILGQIQSFHLTNVLIVVIRYFGGVKLGTGGLIQAYKSAARDALANGRIAAMQWTDSLQVHFQYDRINDVMHLIKEEGLQPERQNFGLECSLELKIRKSKSIALQKKLSSLENVNCSVI